MKTIHLSNCNPCSSEFQKIVADTINHTFNHPHAKKRIISCGSGVVILPDTDYQHDCTPQEIAKALHLKEEIEKSKNSCTESRVCILLIMLIQKRLRLSPLLLNRNVY